MCVNHDRHGGRHDRHGGRLNGSRVQNRVKVSVTEYGSKTAVFLLNINSPYPGKSVTTAGRERRGACACCRKLGTTIGVTFKQQLVVVGGVLYVLGRFHIS